MEKLAMKNNTTAYIFVNNDGLYVSRSSKFLAGDLLTVDMLGITIDKSSVMIFDDDEMKKCEKKMAEIGFMPKYIF